MEEPREMVVCAAEFDRKWKTYFFLKSLLVLIATILGILVAPFWALGFGQWYGRRYFEGLRCVLHERSLVVSRGIYFREERTIPLDKIQDLTLIDGPLLKRFGLSQLKVETASQNASPHGGSEADLVGIVDARAFRDRVLDQRDLLAGFGAAARVGSESSSEHGRNENVLLEIRDSLGRIEKLLASGRSAREQ